MPAAFSAMVILSGCASTNTAPIIPQLPAAKAIFPEPVPRPEIRVGDDARILARRALGYGDSNAVRPPPEAVCL